ncbi:unnamed protein product [Rhizophagus irregularis]|nr:unnamed protein product [Rhizophagus irregularis]
MGRAQRKRKYNDPTTGQKLGKRGIQSPLDITNPRNIGYTDHNEKELPGLRNGRLRREGTSWTSKWTPETRRNFLDFEMDA